MGKVKYLNEVREFFRKTPVVSIRDVKLFVRNNQYAYHLVRNMIKQGEINRITKGFYTIHEDPIVSVFCFKPSYIGLQEALSVYNLWTQETNVVIVTTQKVNGSVKSILDSNVIFHRIKPKYLFGYNLVKYGDFDIPVSDVEKTLIDLVYFNELPDKNIIRNIKKKIDIKKLKSYLKVYSKQVEGRVLSLL